MKFDTSLISCSAPMSIWLVPYLLKINCRQLESVSSPLRHDCVFYVQPTLHYTINLNELRYRRNARDINIILWRFNCLYRFRPGSRKVNTNQPAGPIGPMLNSDPSCRRDAIFADYATHTSHTVMQGRFHSNDSASDWHSSLHTADKETDWQRLDTSQTRSI